MEAISKVVKLHQIFNARRGPISVEDLQDRLECSRPTLYRAIRRLRDDLGAPIVNVRGEGYKYDRSTGEYQLPGLWLSPEEMHALLTMDALLDGIQPGVLSEAIGPVRERIARLLATASPDRAVSAARLREAVQVRPLAVRPLAPQRFARVATATLQGVRLRIAYHGRARDAVSSREISPQRILYYRDNWYLDAWCHAAQAPRRFSLDRILDAEVLAAQPAKAISGAADAPAHGYGIFASPARHKAVLRFTPERARWVADEIWHPQQNRQVLTDGSLELTVPFGDPRELVGDILRHGPEVEVLRPKRLRTAVARALAQAAARYADAPA